ncbi:hypothetical protein AVEN_69853-1 [Araneus ventricosus]|uniref:Uncharacterized protein n=1 Tax=Araneus ventricosus TaxID=182803 RepID=A0A4Y2KCS1_ARAVE|nr:hypothetical protein AVEN_69853-1 [Araneus ventricosus]
MVTYGKRAIKVKNCARTGAGVYEVYKKEFFAYEKMASFLHSVYTPRGTETTEIIRIKKLENEPDNIECDQLDNESEIPVVVDQLESPDINSTSQEEEKYETTAPGTAVNKSGPPTSEQRKAALVEKRKNEAYLLLKQFAAKPWTAKASSIPSTPIPYYQQPGYLPGFSQQCHDMNNHQLPNYGFRENSFSHLSPDHTPTSSAPQHNVNDYQREGHNHTSQNFKTA